MRVVNLRKDKYTVYIGRPSIFGNPFIIGKDGTREEVINLYRHHLRTNLKILATLYDLPKDTILGCYCKPEACHGDVLVEFYNNYWRIK